MEPIISIYVSFFSLAFLFLAYFYWKDASGEGFSPTRIFDSYFVTIAGGLIGGKLLFRALTFDYFRYQLISAPFILEGILIGGFVAIYIYVRKQNIDPWKIGDMFASALMGFQAIVSLGTAIATGIVDYYYISAILFGVFVFMRYLREVKQIGSSKMYFERKRYSNFLRSGSLVMIYLTVLSLVAMLFLLKNYNIYSNFWRFQVGFYIVILFTTYIRYRGMLKKKVRQDGQ